MIDTSIDNDRLGLIKLLFWESPIASMKQAAIWPKPKAVNKIIENFPPHAHIRQHRCAYENEKWIEWQWLNGWIIIGTMSLCGRCEIGMEKQFKWQFCAAHRICVSMCLCMFGVWVVEFSITSPVMTLCAAMVRWKRCHSRNKSNTE